MYMIDCFLFCPADTTFTKCSVFKTSPFIFNPIFLFISKSSWNCSISHRRWAYLGKLLYLPFVESSVKGNLTLGLPIFISNGMLYLCPPILGASLPPIDFWSPPPRVHLCRKFLQFALFIKCISYSFILSYYHYRYDKAISVIRGERRNVAFERFV